MKTVTTSGLLLSVALPIICAFPFAGHAANVNRDPDGATLLSSATVT